MTDKQQPAPERIWLEQQVANGRLSTAWFRQPVEDDDEFQYVSYARVHPVDEARVEEIRERLKDKNPALYGNATSQLDSLGAAKSDIDYLLSLLPQLSGSEMSDDADSLHFAICQAVALMNQGNLHAGHDLLRQTLVDFADKKAPLSRSEIVRKQQHSGGGEVTAVMVSPVSEKGKPQ